MSNKAIPQLSAKQHLAAMKIPDELVTFDDAMAALRRMGEAGAGSLWPTIGGNEIYAFANAVIDSYIKGKP